MQIQPIPSAWQQELALYEEIAGNNQDPLEDIAAQLQSLSPDWTKISADLGQIKTDLQNMIAIVKQNPGMDRNGFLDDLNKALNFVTTLQSQEGDKQTFASSFQNLCAELTDIKQLILRG